MWEAVLISQRPPRLPAPARGRGQIWFLCVWPLIQAMTWSWRSSSASTASPRTRGAASAPVPTRGLVIVSDVWWLNTITSRSADAASVALSQSNCAWSIDPSAYPLGLTVSSTTNRQSPLSKE